MLYFLRGHQENQKIKVLSFAKFQAVLMAFVGLVAGIFYSFGGLVIDLLVTIELVSSASVSTPGLSLGTVLAFGAMIGMPIIFAMFGFVLGLAEVVLYNLFARFFGGIEIEFDQQIKTQNGLDKGAYTAQ